jgi:hypothetical protein
MGRCMICRTMRLTGSCILGLDTSADSLGPNNRASDFDVIRRARGREGDMLSRADRNRIRRANVRGGGAWVLAWAKRPRFATAPASAPEVRR